MDSWLIVQQLRFRIAESNFFAGGRYIYFDTDNTFDIPIDIPEFEGSEISSTLSEASVILNFDTRNNIFTPTKGFLMELSGTYSDTWMGGEDLYGRITTRLIGYVPASGKAVLGVRQENAFTLGDVPFYARPIIMLRGAPLMKYQDKNTTVMEAEINWNVYKRWNLVGFTGMGNAFSSFEDFNEGKSVASIGTGFRYLFARKFGMQMGMDFAQSTDDFAFYFVIGTSWLR
jgi:outer membrane protein assembly factor BamA